MSANKLSNASFARLLAMSRDLLQSINIASVVDLIGPVILELLRPDLALILTNITEEECLMEFDRRGKPQKANLGGSLYKYTNATMLGNTETVLHNVKLTINNIQTDNATILSIPFPPNQPLGAISVVWMKGDSSTTKNRELTILKYISELTAAALGNMVSKIILQKRIIESLKEKEDIEEKHAVEILQKDINLEEKDKIAITDVLTGLLNRRGFFYQAEKSFKSAKRQKIITSVIFADVDGLKIINDKLGHNAGDEYIHLCGEVFGQSFRDSDIVARLGGDEFAAYTVDAEHPNIILNRVRENIAKHNLLQSTYKISISIGITQCDPNTNLSLSDYLSIADQQMYETKKQRKIIQKNKRQKRQK